MVVLRDEGHATVWRRIWSLGRRFEKIRSGRESVRNFLQFQLKTVDTPNLHLPKDTPNLHLHMELFPLEEIQKLAEWHIGQARNSPHWIPTGEAEIQSCHEPHPSPRDTEPGGNTQLWASPCGGKGLDPMSGAPTFKTSTWETGPQNI